MQHDWQIHQLHPNPRNKPQPNTSALDAFVNGDTEHQPTTKEQPVERKPLKRLTFDIAADLHKSIRMTCLERDKDTAEELRRILEENFPA
jgi:hypothetical protein